MRSLIKPTAEDLNAFVQEHSWQYASNYAGEDYSHMVVVCSQHRDSKILAQSNFACALEMLGGEGKHVEVARSGHWAVGWVECILVNPKSKRKLAIAYDIVTSLEDYPVLNEDDYSEREYESYSAFAEGEKKYIALALMKHFGVKESDTLLKLAYELNMEDQYQGGGDSCLNISESRDPDARALRDLARAMDGIAHDYIGNDLRWKNSRIFHKIRTKLATTGGV